jgi:hypothetical protein
MKKPEIIFTVIALVFLCFFAIYFSFFGGRPSIELENIDLGRNVTTVEEAVNIAQSYSLSWDKRSLISHISIIYSSRDDLIFNTPEYSFQSGWNDNPDDGHIFISIRENLLINFTTYNSFYLGYTYPLPKPEKYIYNSDVIDFLDRLAREEGIEWRTAGDMHVSVDFYNYNNFVVRITTDGVVNNFRYENDEIVNVNHIYNYEKYHGDGLKTLNDNSSGETDDTEQSTDYDSSKPFLGSASSETNDTVQSPDEELDFPYQFAGTDTFEFLKGTYGKIDFYGEFKKGDTQKYDLYKEKFVQLIINRKQFLDTETNVEMYLNEYGSFKYMAEGIEKFTFVFFDMDEDSEPELCILDDINCPFIFKYLSDSDEIILWNDYGTGLWYSLIGSNKMSWNREGISHVFYKLYEDGKTEYDVSFYSKPYFNRKTEDGEIIFAVSVPMFTGETQNIELTDEMKSSAYFDKYQERYYFRLTEEQYEELTYDYFESYKMSTDMIKEVSFSYREFTGYKWNRIPSFGGVLPKEGTNL